MKPNALDEQAQAAWEAHAKHTGLDTSEHPLHQFQFHRRETTAARAAWVAGMEHAVERMYEEPILVDWSADSGNVLDEFDAIHAEYKTTQGRQPDADMAHTMRRQGLRIMHWWAWHREAIREALAAKALDKPREPQPTWLCMNGGKTVCVAMADTAEEALIAAREQHPILANVSLVAVKFAKGKK